MFSYVGGIIVSKKTPGLQSGKQTSVQAIVPKYFFPSR